MKTLVVYFSRDGHTRTVAQEIATALDADIEEIREFKSRKGILGWVTAIVDIMRKNPIHIKPTSIDPTIYDLVVVGTPVWGFTLSPGTRSWLAQHGKNLKKVAFFVTMGGSGDKRTFTNMEELCGQPPFAATAFIDKKIEKNEHKPELDVFLNLLTKEE